MSTFPLRRTDPLPAEVGGGAVTVGNFDGVHRGHRDLVAAARRLADDRGGPAVAVTFDPPPYTLVSPGLLKPPLATLAERAELLHAAGADHVAILHTDPGLVGLSAEAFFAGVLVGKFGATAVAEGYNFRFGKDRAGDTALLSRLCAAAGIAFTEVPPRLVAGEPVSSTRVRSALVGGDVAAAADLLGRPYRIRGVVEGGARRGRTLGFPTANMGSVQTLVPGVGVYAVRAILSDGTIHPAAANVGPNPTFGDDGRKIEVHLIGFGGDLYGQPMTAAFVAKLRDTRPFSGAAELVEQLRRDVDAAKAAVG